MAMKVASFFCQYANEVNFKDPVEVNELTTIIKKNIDVFKELATTYQHRYVKLSLHKITRVFVPDIDYLYTRDVAGYLPDALRWYDSKIDNIYSFFELLLLRINVLGKFKINDEEGSLARYFRVHKRDMKRGLDVLIKTYQQYEQHKSTQLDTLMQCTDLLDPLDDAFDKLYDPMVEKVNSNQLHYHIYSERGSFEDLLKLDQLKEIQKFLYSTCRYVTRKCREALRRGRSASDSN